VTLAILAIIGILVILAILVILSVVFTGVRLRGSDKTCPETFETETETRKNGFDMSRD